MEVWEATGRLVEHKMYSKTCVECATVHEYSTVRALPMVILLRHGWRPRARTGRGATRMDVVSAATPLPRARNTRRRSLAVVRWWIAARGIRRRYYSRVGRVEA